MSYIPLEAHLPGITGLLEYRKDTAAPIRELTQILLRGLSSLTEGARELIATVGSNKSECRFCTAAHTDPELYQSLGERLKNHGYNRLAQGYDHLKKQTAE